MHGDKKDKAFDPAAGLMWDAPARECRQPAIADDAGM